MVGIMALKGGQVKREMQGAAGIWRILIARLLYFEGHCRSNSGREDLNLRPHDPQLKQDVCKCL
jgi:hypothetical protein